VSRSPDTADGALVLLRELGAHLRDAMHGTRGLMYDKRPAWALAAAAPQGKPAWRGGYRWEACA
jgi:hypothetical protein